MRPWKQCRRTCRRVSASRDVSGSSRRHSVVTALLLLLVPLLLVPLAVGVPRLLPSPLLERATFEAGMPVSTDVK